MVDRASAKRNWEFLLYGFSSRDEGAVRELIGKPLIFTAEIHHSTGAVVARPSDDPAEKIAIHAEISAALASGNESRLRSIADKLSSLPAVLCVILPTSKEAQAILRCSAFSSSVEVYGIFKGVRKDTQAIEVDPTWFGAILSI